MSGRDNRIVPAPVSKFPISVHTVPTSVNTAPIPLNTVLVLVNTVPTTVNNTAVCSMNKKKAHALLKSHSNALCFRMIHTATCLHIMNTMKVSYPWYPRKPQSPILKRCSHFLILIPLTASPTAILAKDGRLFPKEQPHNGQVLRIIQSATHPPIPHREISHQRK